MSGLGWQDIFKDIFEPENETMKKTIRGTKTRVVKKPKQKAITFAGLKREIAKLTTSLDTLTEQLEIAERGKKVALKDKVNAEGQRDELQSVLNELGTCLKFRLDTAFPNSPVPNHDPYMNGPIDAEAISEEEHVLRKLLDMTTSINFKRDYGDSHEMGVLRRGY